MRDEHTLSKTSCAAGFSPSPRKSFQEKQAGRSKKATPLHWPFALLVVGNTGERHTIPHLNDYLSSPWEAAEFLRTGGKMLETEKTDILCTC